MSELTRISISLEDNLLGAFDGYLSSKGYSTRSEAIRDLIRDRLIREQGREAKGEQIAVLSMVYDHHGRELAARLLDKQHHHHALVIASLNIHLGSRHCLEVSILRGPVADVKRLGDELIATKGVLHGDMILTSAEESLNLWH